MTRLASATSRCGSVCPPAASRSRWCSSVRAWAGRGRAADSLATTGPPGAVAVFLQHPDSYDAVWKNQPVWNWLAALRKAASLKNFAVGGVSGVARRAQIRGHPAQRRAFGVHRSRAARGEGTAQPLSSSGDLGAVHGVLGCVSAGGCAGAGLVARQGAWLRHGISGPVVRREVSGFEADGQRLSPLPTLSSERHLAEGRLGARKRQWLREPRPGAALDATARGRGRPVPTAASICNGFGSRLRVSVPVEPEQAPKRRLL